MDWIDKFLSDDECSLYQITAIESLMKTSSASYKYINTEIVDLTYKQAKDILKDLIENDNPTDPREQFKKMFN